MVPEAHAWLLKRQIDSFSTNFTALLRNRRHPPMQRRASPTTLSHHCLRPRWRYRRYRSSWSQVPLELDKTSVSAHRFKPNESA